MRPVRTITADEENFRIEHRSGFEVTKRDSIEPEPIGTLILKAFRIIGYDPDCDGSLMAQLEAIDSKSDPTGWTQDRIGLYPDTAIVITEDELSNLFH